MPSMTRAIDLVSRYQILMIMLMLALGFLLPTPFLLLGPWNSFFLQVILFVTGLRTDFKEFAVQARDWRALVLANSMMLVLLPYLVAIPLRIFAPDWTVPFVLAAALPTALTAPAVMAILGGNISLTILISVSTNLLAPVTIPLVLRVLVAQDIQIDLLSMMGKIATAVFIPLGLAALIQWRFGRKKIERYADPIRAANLLAFALVIVSVAAGSVATGATSGKFLGIGADGVLIVVLMTIYWFGVAWLATALLAWRSRQDRMTLTFCLLYMSAVLGIWIADNFFREEGVALKLIAIFVTTTLILPLFKLIIPEEKKGLLRKVRSVEWT